ncbi:MAG: hypothetical protein K1Y01_15155 [Vicinamibacteria bacterium]|nr:hypothetical protein [Vicinamibacteria bacterium]
MIKPMLKTLSFSFVTLASAAMLSAAEQAPKASEGAAETLRVGCATQAEIDLGWEEQIAQLEKRLAEREAEGRAVPGAIITPPFESFAPYRADVPKTLAAGKAAKASRRTSPGEPSRD